MQRITHVLSDGRRAATHLGEGDGRLVVLCHPAPGSGAFDPDPGATAARGVRLLAVDRPGYGTSDGPRDGSWAGVADAADDCAAILDAHGVRAVGVAGWSAGGRVALALAARRPDLVSRVAVIATPAPHEAVAWIPEPQVAMIDSLRGLAPDAVHAAMLEMMGGIVPDDPWSAAARELVGVGDADADALAREGAADRLSGMLA